MIRTALVRWYSWGPPFKVYKGYLLPSPPARPSAVTPAPLKKKMTSETKSTVPLDEYPKNHKEQASEKERYSSQMKEYNERFIEPLKQESAYTHFIREKWKEAKQREGRADRVGFKSVIEQWRNLSKEEKQKYELPKANKDKELEYLKPFKIPNIEAKTPQQLAENKKQVQEFCEKHGLSVYELFVLIAKGSSGKKVVPFEQVEAMTQSQTKASSGGRQQKDYEQQHRDWPFEQPQNLDLPIQGAEKVIGALQIHHKEPLKEDSPPPKNDLSETIKQFD